MTSAEIVTIGTELLLGEIVDTNSAYLARNLRDIGVDVFRTSTVGDNADRIAAMIRETMDRAQIIITTGGLGPTVDDPTRDAIAKAVGVETEFRPELWDQIVERLSRFNRTPTENQKRQAYIPKGSIAIKNPVGTAPAFIVERDDRTIISLPGVPREMEYLLEHSVIPYLRERYALKGIIKARVLHTAGFGEAVVDEKIGDLEELANPTVGLAAHAGMVDVRITAKAESEEEADALIATVEADLRSRLGNAIFGADSETLEGAALAQLQRLGWTLSIVEAGGSGILIQKLSASNNGSFLGGEILPLIDSFNLKETTTRESITRKASVTIGIALRFLADRSEIELCILTPHGAREETFSYGGHPRLAPYYAATLTLNLLRRMSA